jgi:hypothetical protein
MQETDCPPVAVAGRVLLNKRCFEKVTGVIKTPLLDGYERQIGEYECAITRLIKVVEQLKTNVKVPTSRWHATSEKVDKPQVVM